MVTVMSYVLRYDSVLFVNNEHPHAERLETKSQIKLINNNAYNMLPFIFQRFILMYVLRSILHVRTTCINYDGQYEHNV